ncbi:MAG: DNA methylase [Candidatus Cryptobacteroides sp.]
MNTFIAIDLKSYYASVECVERGLDPLTTNLVVADESRTNKTVCLAVSPSLKAFGIGGRARLFEVEQRVKELNRYRKDKIEYIVAPPRMAFYMKYSARIYDIYLRYFSAEDIHVYSIDEVFIDATHYLGAYKMNAHDLTIKIIREVLKETGITATAGIGTNLYLCKVAMDIVAKHIEPDADGVRIAELDEISYRRLLWEHKPLTDFWRVGPGTAAHLDRLGISTMGELALYSLKYEDFLFKEFGVNAELLIDHAWGHEPCSLKAIKEYKPQENSLSRGQVLTRPYKYKEALIVALEMSDLLSLTLVEKGLLAGSLCLVICYDQESLSDPKIDYRGEIKTDHYGRSVPKHSQGIVNFPNPSSSGINFSQAVKTIFEEKVNKKLLIRRIYLTANKVVREEEGSRYTQMDLFAEEDEYLLKERGLQEALISIKKKYGGNSILKGYSFEEGATAKERNQQIGGHKA